MKLKKKVKIFLVLIILILIVVGGFFLYNSYFKTTETKETKVLNTIEDYNYTLKDNKTSTYKKMFEELEKILSSDSVDEEEYVKQISKMFIYDFYSLEDKTAKIDVGGVDFVYSNVLENFCLNAEDTYYKYVESNIYGNRNQDLPTVDEITIEDVSQDIYAIESGETDSEAYYVKVNWTYTSDEFEDYQDSATLVFIHNGKRLDLVELQK